MNKLVVFEPFGGYTCTIKSITRHACVAVRMSRTD